MAIVVKYGAKWCGPCKKSKENYLEVQRSYKNKNVSFYDVDIDNPTCDPELPEFFIKEIDKLNSIPFVIIKNANTGEIVRMKGWNEADVRKELEYALPKEKSTDYSIIKPGMVITSDNEDSVEVDLTDENNLTDDDDFILNKNEKDKNEEELEFLVEKE